MTLAARSIRTLAWLGDAIFELDVRRRLALRGDYPTARLDAMKADIVCAPRQAEFLLEIAPHLDEEESAVVRRGRNANVGSKAGGKVDVRTHRSATAFEALVAFWSADPTRTDRYETMLAPLLGAAIDDAIGRLASKPQRG